MRDGVPLVTVTGPGGIGKTELVRTFLAAGAEACAGLETFFSDLTDAADAHGICSVVAQTLGVPLADARDAAAAIETVAFALGARRALLVLDGFDRVTRHAADVVGAWLSEAPELQILVTSRERLLLPEELVLEVAPLSLPAAGETSGEAVELWDACASAPVGAPQERAVVARLVRELEGIPLAIELAAARSSVLGPATLLARLEQRFELLRTEARSGTTTGRATLRGAIDASWDLLTEPERSVLAQCASFRGSFTLEAAEEVVDVSTFADAPSTLDVLEALHNKSLLRSADHEGGPGERRLSLYSTIRDYAEEKLAKMEGEREARLRHARHCARKAELLDGQLRGREMASALARLAVERDDLTSAAARCLGGEDASCDEVELALRILVVFDPKHWVFQPLVVFLGQLDAAFGLPASRRVAPAVQARALSLRARIALRTGRADEAVRHAEAAAAFAASTGDAALVAATEVELADARVLTQLRLDDAEASCRRALAAARGAGRTDLEGMVLTDLGALARHRGQTEVARRHVESALSMLRDAGALRSELRALVELTCIHLDASNPDLARAYAEQARTTAHAAGIRWQDGIDLFLLASVEMAAGNKAEAVRLFEEVVRVARALGDGRLGATASAYGALTKCELGDFATGIWQLRESISQMMLHGRRLYASLFRGLFAAILAASDELEEAAACVATAEAELTAGHATLHLAAVGLCRGVVDVLRARRAGDASAEAEAIAAGRARLAEAEAGAPDSTPLVERLFEARLAAGMLARALDGVKVSPAARRSPGRLVVDAEGRWFRLGADARVECGRRPVLRRLLAALVHERVTCPGRSLSPNDLVAAGWPGERILASAAKNRLYVSITRLRELGLRDVVMADESGYLLDATLDIETSPR